MQSMTRNTQTSVQNQKLRGAFQEQNIYAAETKTGSRRLVCTMYNPPSVE